MYTQLLFTPRFGHMDYWVGNNILLFYIASNYCNSKKNLNCECYLFIIVCECYLFIIVLSPCAIISTLYKIILVRVFKNFFIRQIPSPYQVLYSSYKATPCFLIPAPMWTTQGLYLLLVSGSHTS